MTELKTLKDIPSYKLTDDGGCNDPGCCGGMNYYICECKDGEYKKIDELRAEAVKWIKAFRAHKPANCDDTNCELCDYCDIGILYTFFDITKEDLK